MKILIDNYVGVLKKYAVFEGTASRQEYWLFFAVNFVVGLVLGIIPIVDMIYALAVLLPGLAVAARRLRDAGFSPWWLLLLLTGIGLLVVLIMCALPGKRQAA